MEDALVRFIKSMQYDSVLILVVMEDALVHEQFHSYGVCLQVLILVVMEDALVPQLRGMFARMQKCLNPCCNGRCTRTQNLGYALFKRIVRLDCAS